jgi:hypothetical protein
VVGQIFGPHSLSCVWARPNFSFQIGNVYLLSFCHMSDLDSDSSSVEEHKDLLLIKMRASDLNFKDLPPLDKTDMEMIAQFAGSSSNKALKETASKNLYCFVACLALEHVSTECNRKNMRNLWLLAFSNFGEVLNCYFVSYEIYIN